MSFELHHTLVGRRFTPEERRSNAQTFFSIKLQGRFTVLFPGLLVRRASASFSRKVRVDNPQDPSDENPQRPGTTPLHGGLETVTQPISLKLRIFTPEGSEFTASKITLADLRKFRDLRGRPSGTWSYTLTGESVHIDDDDDPIILGSEGSLAIALTEKVASESAPPLVNNVPITPTGQSFKFDLYRVGTFVAEISSLQAAAPWRGSMRLIDPDGVEVADTRDKKLTFSVSLRTLNKSRDTEGKVRQWSLEVSPQGGVVAGSPHLSATVIGKGRIRIATLQSRIDALLGQHGEFIKIFGENKDGEILARLMITDPISAETIDMHELLSGALAGVRQDGNANPANIQANTVYTLGRRSEIFNVTISDPVFGKELVDVDFTINCDTLKVSAIEVAIGPGDMLGASVPAIKLTLTVEGSVKLRRPGHTIATGKIRGGKVAMEMGFKLLPNGTPEIVTAVTPSPLDFDLSDGATAVVTLISPILAAVVDGYVEGLEDGMNKDIAKGTTSMFSGPTLLSKILMTIFGAHLTYKPFRVTDDEIVFDHIAPIEPESKPTAGYQGAIGRSFSELEPNVVTFIPPALGDTWRADNLASKIKHIVVVMMENRSYDHVLGYRSRKDIRDGADGLTTRMVTAIETAPNGPFDVRSLRRAGFKPNSIGKMTRLPKKVGHELDDVTQQLSIRAAGPDDRKINSPKGFVDNFKPRLESDPQGVVAADVLGIYDEQDLPFFAFLAENYAYCDQYYSSHPGPTLPNRMYSLAGDLQHDRLGVPIPDSNNSDNFLLSRAPTIYDLLLRKGVSFRIYESVPSVTMLRMFARYATDNTHIVPRAQLEADIAPGGRGLPAFTVIEPQMHSQPEDDDHPAADMHRGQIFLKGVYDALTSNRALWESTLLIISYDEHGGFYDHVVPPIADVYNTLSGSPVLETGALLAASSTKPSPLLTTSYGVRVPAFVVSPWTGRGKGPSVTLDHCSILKTVLARFLGAEKPFLSDRVSASHSFEAFLTETAPRMNVPPSPPLRPLPFDPPPALSPTSQIMTRPLSRQEMREGPVDYHELTGRWARQLGR